MPFDLKPKLKSASAGRPLPASVRMQMEEALGADFSTVRLHQGPEAAALGAEAATLGERIFFAPGYLDTSSRPGRERLAHELTHVRQQREGRVCAAGAGLAVDPDPHLESEAAAAGRAAAAGLPAGLGPATSRPGASSPATVIQRVTKKGKRKKRREDETQNESENRIITTVSPQRFRFDVYDRLTFPLDELSGRTDLSAWSGGKEHLSGAHHIFPKSVLSWLYDHTSPAQKDALRRFLRLPENAGAGALVRIGSNLISSQTSGGATVRPEQRTDDPHHKRHRSRPGEEYLDLVRTQGGLLDPRSAAYHALAKFLIRYIYPRFKEEGDSFVLTDREAGVIFRLIRFAETYHYYVEQEPRAPSFHRSDFWQGGPGTYAKGLPPYQAPPSSRQLLERYGIRKRREEKEELAATRKVGFVRKYREAQWKLEGHPPPSLPDQTRREYMEMVIRLAFGNRARVDEDEYDY